MKLKGALLDLEGVLVSNRKLQNYVIVQGFNKAGITFRLDLSKVYYLRSFPEFHEKKNFFRCLLALHKLEKIATVEEINKKMALFNAEDERVIKVAVEKYSELRRDVRNMIHMVQRLGKPDKFTLFLKKHGFKIAIVTNANRMLAKAILEKFDIYYDILVTEDETGVEKPNALPFKHAMEKLHLNPQECFVLEDSVAGIEAGRKAGCKTIGILTGNATEKQLIEKKPGFIAKDLIEVESWLEEINGEVEN